MTKIKDGDEDKNSKLIYFHVDDEKLLEKYKMHLQLHVVGFQIWYFRHALCSFEFWHSHQHFSLFHFWFEVHFLSSNLNLHSHDICFAGIFDSFIFIIILKILKFKSALLFETMTLLDKSLRVLQLPMHLSNLTGNGY